MPQITVPGAQLEDSPDCRDVWTTFFHPAKDRPLTLCDGSTVASEDTIAIRKIRQGSKKYGLCALDRRRYK